MYHIGAGPPGGPDASAASCPSPAGAWDSDRSRIVVFCGAVGFTYEFHPDTNAWATLSPKHVPAIRSFGSLVYDQHLKKSVLLDRKSTRLNSSHQIISYAVFCLKKKK